MEPPSEQSQSSSVRMRSSSVGNRPRARQHRVSRAESAQAVALDVRCACQFYQTLSLLPERINPASQYEPQGICPKHPPISAQIASNHIISSTANSTHQMSHVASIAPVPLSSSNELIHPNDRRTDEIQQPIIINRDNLHASNALQAQSEMRDRHASASILPQASNFDLPVLRQRDPSQSSLVKRRMSAERHGGSATMPSLKRSTSQWSNVSGGSETRVITQKDPTQSTILRRKMYNKATTLSAADVSHRKTNDDIWCTRTQPLCIPTHQPTSVRTLNREIFAHVPIDDEMMIDRLENERYIEAEPMEIETKSTNKKPLRKEEWSIEVTEEHKGAIIQIEQPSKKGEAAKLVAPEKPKRQENILRMMEMTVDRGDTDNSAVRENLKQVNASDVKALAVDALPPMAQRQQSPPFDDIIPKPKRKHSELMRCEEIVQENIAPTKVQVQHVARMMEAETLEYTHCKHFDNYCSASELNQAPKNSNEMPFVRQRDPSQSRFTRDRYRTPTPTISMSTEVDLNRNDLSHLPHEKFIAQKDLRTSKLLQRRRRNLSQASLQDENSSQMAMTSAFIDSPAKLSKTVSFEFDKQIETESFDRRNERINNENQLRATSDRNAIQR